MGTILDYIREYGDYTFSEKPLNEVDSLVLCQFAYLKFDGIVPGAGEHGDAVSMSFLESHQDFELLREQQRLPGVYRGDGFYMALFQRKDSGGNG